MSIDNNSKTKKNIIAVFVDKVTAFDADVHLVPARNRKTAKNAYYVRTNGATSIGENQEEKTKRKKKQSKENIIRSSFVFAISPTI